MSRRNSFLKLNKNHHQIKPSDSPKFDDLDILDDGFDAEQNHNNPFSSSQPSSSVSKWSLNESWRKIQQIMESKDKQANQNSKQKELHSQELSNFSTDDAINDISDYSIHEGEEIEEGTLSGLVDFSDLSQESIKNINIVQPTNSTMTSNNNTDTTTTTTTSNSITANNSNNQISSSSSSSTLINQSTNNSTNNNISNEQPTINVNSSNNAITTTNNSTSTVTISANSTTTTTTTAASLSSSSSSSIITTSITTPSTTTTPTTTITNKSTTSSSNTIKENNKRDDIKTHTSFLFSKMKKNHSIELLNELDDKETEKELFDKRKESLNEPTTSSKNVSLGGLITTMTGKQQTSTTTKTHQLPLQQTSTTAHRTPTPTKQPSTLTNRLNPLTKSSSTSSRSSTLRSRHQMNRFKDLSEENLIDGLNTVEGRKQSLNIVTSGINNVDDPLPSLPNFMSFIVNFFREKLNFFTVTTSFCTFFLLIFAIQLSPLSSFANGFLIGIIFSILFLFIVVVYALNYIFKKIDYENELHERILTGQRWQKYPAYKKLNTSNDNSSTSKLTTSNCQTSGIYEGWFFELVYSKKLGVDRMTAAEKTDYEKMPDTKLQLTYIKLEGTIMRVYIPKADQSKKINVDKVNFVKVANKMNQHIYDFSKMNSKKIQLWLPKNIINKKKYLWSRKFPFILVIEETNKMSEKQRTPFNLILFCRTNRDKEEWYNRFRQSIEIAEQNLQIHHLSTAASTPDEVTHEQENIPRAKSLDIGNISYEFEHLSSFLSYDTFIQDLLSHNLYSFSGNTAGGNQSTSTNSQPSTSNGNNTGSNVVGGGGGNQANSNDQQNSNLFWFNTLVGRVFFDFLTHPHWTRWVQLKIQRKLSRIKLPFFIQTICLKDVNLGTSMPKFLNVVNNPTIDEKGIWIDFDLDYQGCFSMTLETKLDLMKLKETKAPERELKPIKSPSLNQSPFYECDDELSDPESIVSLSDEDSEENLSIENTDGQARFVKLLDKLVVNKYFQQATDTKFVKKKMEEVSNLPILLTVNIYKLKGVLTLNLPPAPTDRLWYGFRSISDFVLECKPSFGERSIQLNPITQILSKKLKQEFHKILVFPNLDDIVLNNIMKGFEDINIIDGEVS